MNSISTNPFDDDTDNDSIAAASPSANHKRLRKKRQAPLPPVIPKVIICRTFSRRETN